MADESKGIAEASNFGLPAILVLFLETSRLEKCNIFLTNGRHPTKKNKIEI